MSPAPPLSLVQELHNYDPRLRLRWARHQKVWMIEVKAEERSPAWVSERPNPMGSTPRAMDVWEGWKEGYCFVVFIHPSNLQWAIIAPHLQHLRLKAEYAKTRLLERLEEAERQQEEAAKREWDTINEAGAKDLYDRLGWDQGRTVSLNEPGPNPKEEARDGYIVVDRRVAV